MKPSREAFRQRFTFQQRPYITIADTLDSIYRDFSRRVKVPREAVAPFDFTVYNLRPDGRESFRWIIGYDHQKFCNILANKALFKAHANLVFENSDQLTLDEHYRDVILSERKVDDIEFLTAVLHLTYCFNVHNAFNVGLIHKEYRKRFPDLRGTRLEDCNCYRAKMCLDQLDEADLPALQIVNCSPQYQVNKAFFHKEYFHYRDFYKDWTYAIQGILSQRQINYQYIHHLYFPIFDGKIATKIALRGYLGVFLADEKYLDQAENYFRKHGPVIRSEISEAYKRGTHNYILTNYDYYKKKQGALKTINYWSKHIGYMHQWNDVEVVKKPAKEEIYWLEDDSCNINLEKVLCRQVVSNVVDQDLLQRHAGHVLVLGLPSALSELLREEPGKISFLEKRIKGFLNLLDDILQKRDLIKKESFALKLAMKSAVAAVMSRNMSHNLGSHVLAKLSTPEDVENWPEAYLDNEIPIFNSYLRTRMDFLADMSTATPTVVTPLKIYRDVLSYFKPAFVDEERIAWQRLLLDLISGVDYLSSRKIEVVLLKDGEVIQLDQRLKDLTFACPNGLLGAHALYIIIENIIRNSSKHAFNPEVHDNLQVTIDIRESVKFTDLLEIVVYDNLANADSFAKVSGGQQQLIEYLNEKIQQSSLGDDSTLRAVAWGLLEMKISAAYLRRIPAEELDGQHKVPILEALAVGKNLGYRFYLEKPKEVLFVDTRKRLSENPAFKEALKGSSCGVVAVRDFIDLLPNNIEHDFLVLIDPDQDLILKTKHYSTALPIRILTNDPNISDFPCIDIDNFFPVGMTPDIEMEEFIRDIWKTFLNFYQEKVWLFIRSDDNYVRSKWQIQGISFASKDVDAIEGFDPFKKYVVYDRHGDMAKLKSEFLTPMMEKEQILFYEGVQQNEPTCFVINDASIQTSLNLKTAYKLIESGLNKVVILDERIQKILGDLTDDTSNRLKRFQMMNIVVPEKNAIDLDAPKIVYDTLKSWLSMQLVDADFLVIHLGILEKRYDDDVSLIRKEVERIQSEAENLEIILISGRGLSSAMYELNLRFIHYSQIARCLLEVKSKYHLNKILYSSRRPIR